MQFPQIEIQHNLGNKIPSKRDILPEGYVAPVNEPEIPETLNESEEKPTSETQSEAKEEVSEMTPKRKYKRVLKPRKVYIFGKKK